MVGDIIDIWSMQKSVHWPQSHNNIIRTILGKAKHGTTIIYIPGNHDGLLRDFEGAQFGEVELKNHAIHTTADGKKLLVLHGDEFDNLIRCNGLVSIVGNLSYGVIMWTNRLHNYIRRLLKMPYWSLASYLKHKSKNACDYIGRFETIVSKEAHRQGMDGLVCGHLHRPELRFIDDVLYCNDGDWVESCTALVETHHGKLQLIHWGDEKSSLKDITLQKAS